MQVRMLRFPGGSASDEYHWGTNRSEGASFPWPTDFNAFARVAIDTGADVMVTTNYGTGSAEEAAGWVEDSNINKGRHFVYWEIGNEVYGSWETDKHTRPHDPWVYAAEVAHDIHQMKRVDPTITIGIPIVPSEDDFANYDDEIATNSRTGGDHKGWSPLVLTRLRELDSLPDFVSYHRYEYNPLDEDDATLLQAARSWPADIAKLRQILQDYAKDNGSIEIFCTENNSVTSRPGKQTTSLINALYLADSLGQSLQTEVGTVLWWDLRNAQEFANNNSPGLYGWRNYGDYGVLSPSNERYPTSYVAELFSAFAKPNDVVVSATSSASTIAAYATKHPDGSVSILLINKDRDHAIDVAIKFNVFTPANGDAPLWTYGKANDIAQSDITRSTLRVSSTPITVHTEAYSATVLTMAKGAPGKRRAIHR